MATRLVATVLAFLPGIALANWRDLRCRTWIICQTFGAGLGSLDFMLMLEGAMRRTLYGAILIGLCASRVHAAGNEQGQVAANWNVYGDGYVFFNLTGTHISSPCSIAERWAFNTTSAVGKSWYAAFLLAYASGKTLAVSGNGVCVHGNTEEVTNLHMLD